MVSDDSNLSPTRKYERDQFRNRINGYAESFRRQDGFKELQHEYGKFARLARKLIKEEGLVQQNKNEVRCLRTSHMRCKLIGSPRMSMIM